MIDAKQTYQLPDILVWEGWHYSLWMDRSDYFWYLGEGAGIMARLR